ncbi:MAG: RHS repeat-associated core domain-containing protein, partial [Holophagales bacterium]|nr:RHS repeat-associated core domain-containing protein [Holophagales bacterium]
LPDGTQASAEQDPDPRFGLLSRFASAASLARPNGSTADIVATRTLTLSDPDDPFSITNLSAARTVEGRTNAVAYDGASRRFSATSPESRIASLAIDAQGRPTTTQSTSVEPMSVHYRPSGEVEKVIVGPGEGTHPTDRVTSFGYDVLHRLETVTGPEDHTTTYGYDAANRPTSITLPDGQVLGLGYDANGNLTRVSPPGKPAHVFTYTVRNQLATYTLPDVGNGPSSAVESRFYDADGRLVRLVRPDAEELGFTYEPGIGRLQTITTPRGNLGFTYEPTDGKLATITTFDSEALTFGYDGPLLDSVAWSGTVSGSVERTYDPTFRLTELRVNGTDPISYAYDGDSLVTNAGGLTIQREPATGRAETTSLGKVTSDWTYTAFGQVETFTWSYDGTPIYVESFTYDKRGWITDKVRTETGSTETLTYGYDDRGRLETVELDGAPLASYGYDANSNRTSYDGPFGAVTSITYDARDRLTEYGITTYTYTEAGQLATKTQGGQTVTYDYDVLGNLRQVSLPSGTTIDYVIDGAQRRVGKKVDGVLTRAWLYQDGLNPIAELDAAGNVVARFVYGTRANLPDYMIKGGVTYALIPDHLGSPRLVVDIATGTIAQRLHYDEFGRITLDTNPGFQPFGFAGGLYDPQTGLVRLGARDYDPEVGRWTAPDPAGFAGGDPNLYAYAASNPVSFVDLTGYSLRSAVVGFARGLAVGVVVGAVAAAAVAAAPAAAPLVLVAGAISLATAYFEGQALYYDPAVSEDVMHEYLGEVTGSVVGCVVGYRGYTAYSASRGSSARTVEDSLSGLRDGRNPNVKVVNSAEELHGLYVSLPRFRG